jgi:hypothetical protein
MSDPRHAKLDRWYRRNYNFGTDLGEVPSVTTQLKAMYSFHLERWKIRRAIDTSLRMGTRAMREVHKQSEPNEKGERHDSGAVLTIEKELSKPSAAQTRGVGVHEALEAWFETGSIPEAVTDEEHPYVEQAIKWAMEWNPRPIHMEPEVYAEAGYAGSVDGLFQIGQETCIVDYKTGGVFESAAMQLAAYAHADRLYPRINEEQCAIWAGADCECPWEPMPAVDRLAVLQLKPDSYELQWVTPVASGLAWRAFQGAMSINRLKKHKALFVTARQAQEEAA